MFIIILILILIVLMGFDTTIGILAAILSIVVICAIVRICEDISESDDGTDNNISGDTPLSKGSLQNSTHNILFSTDNKTVELNEPVSYTLYKKYGLSYKAYIIKAKYTKTKRMRKLTREYHNSYTYEYIKTLLTQEGYEEPFEISIDEDYNTPTERQIEYAKDLNIPLHSGLGKYDISCLIDRVLEHSGEPNPGLIEFADDERLLFSYCIGKKQLYDLVFNQLPDKKSIAFFIFSIYRFLYNDREANMNKSPYFNVFLSFADKYVNDVKFIKSMYDNYEGRDLRYFGTVNITKPNGQITQIYGGSNRTYSYQEAKRYLMQHFGKI